MSEIKIIAVKLIKGGEQVEIKYKISDSVNGSVDFIGENEAHPDLKAKFQALAVHLAVISDYIPPKNAHKSSEIEKFIVSAYKHWSKEDNPGVTLTGYKLTARGRAQNFNTHLAFEGTDENQYILLDDLTTKLADLDAETLLYLQEGKKAPDPQQSLFPDEDERVTSMQIVEPEDQDDVEQDEDGEDEFQEDETPASKKVRGGLPYADKEAQGRVQEWSAEEYIGEVNKTAAKKSAKPGKPGRNKKNA